MEFKKIVLKNGLTILHEKRDVPVTTVMLAVKYGAEYEGEEEKGIAHFIEHLCFKGTEKRNHKEIVESVERLGGDLNAFTHEEMTAYHVKLPSEHLEIAMDVISDVFFNAAFPEEEVEKEANVICEEIKMYKDNPRAHVLDMIKNGLYERPFGMFIGGEEKNVLKITRADLYRRHREVYCPQNSILCVVGNNEFEDVVRLAKKFCVDRTGKEIEPVKIKKKISLEVEKRENLNQASLAIGIHFPNLSEKQRYAAEVFCAILGEGLSSKLFLEVREKRGLVYSIRSELDLGKDYGYMVISAGTDSSKVDEVVKISEREFSKMKDLSEEELEAAKVQVIGNRYVESENSGEVAMNLVLEEVSGDAKDYYEYEKNIRKVSLADIKKIAGISKFSSFVLGPK